MGGWSEACILNLSSRGLMINAPAAFAQEGSTIELWHDGRVIIGTIMWRNGTRAGLQAEDRIPVDDILAVGQAAALQLTAADWPEVDRRSVARPEGESRLRGRAIEFAGLVMIAASLGIGAFTMMNEAFAAPIRYVEAALGR